MKIWNIIYDELETAIEFGDITVLYGQHMQWYNTVRLIDNYFNGRTPEIRLYEDGLPVNKKDWQCFFIPFDAEVQLNKITAKSPMKDVQSGVSEQITFSPFFQELQDVWEQLNDELQLINKQLGEMGLSSSLRPFEERDMSDFIQFHSSNDRSLSPLAIKRLLLNIILNRPFDKKTLIIIELPELYADNGELKIFNQQIKKAVIKGYKFLFVSNLNKHKVINYFYENTIINNALLEQMKNKIQKEVPFYCSDELYEEAKNSFLKIVDNSLSKKDLVEHGETDIGAIVTIIQVIMYNLNIGTIYDTHGLEPNLIKFLSKYS